MAQCQAITKREAALLAERTEMGWKRDVAIWLNNRGLLPGRFIKCYVLPLLVRGKKNPYQGGQFFESYYKTFAKQAGLTDSVTLAPNVHPAHCKYHYNATENSIISSFVRWPLREAPSVLDIGSGAGHWIDFWLATYSASFVCGFDVSKTCAEALRTKYAGMDNVVIMEADISLRGVFLGRKFDVISAIGVIFHIVDDALWRQALVNMRNLLSDGGVIVVGGHFGWTTQDVQFHLNDNYEDLEQAINSLQGVKYTFQRGQDAGDIYVNKRIRSLRYWKSAAAEAGLRVQMVRKTPSSFGIPMPENNIMLLTAASG